MSYSRSFVRIISAGKLSRPKLRWRTYANVRCLCQCQSARNPHDPERTNVGIKIHQNWHPSYLQRVHLHSDSEKSMPRDADYLDACDSDTFNVISKGFVVYENFINSEEEQHLLEEIEPHVRRLRYETDHWDDAIHGYRETERKQWNDKNKVILQRVQDLAFPGSIKLDYIHILDIQKTGFIKPHIDSVRFCGSTIAGLSLLSSSVMRLVHEKEKEKWAEALLKRRSLYIMKDSSRYNYTHEILGSDLSRFKGKVIPRDRRISIMCRNEPTQDSQ